MYPRLEWDGYECGRDIERTSRDHRPEENTFSFPRRARNAYPRPHRGSAWVPWASDRAAAQAPDRRLRQEAPLPRDPHVKQKPSPPTAADHRVGDTLAETMATETGMASIPARSRLQSPEKQRCGLIWISLQQAREYTDYDWVDVKTRARTPTRTRRNTHERTCARG